MVKKEELLYEFWRIYDTAGIKDALLYLDNNGYHNTTENSHYDNYTNELTTDNALNSMLSSLTLNL